MTGKRLLPLDEVKQLQLEMLEAYDTICKKLNTTYYLCGGTLLGAVRHQGIIPWDDDIDLMMPRPDYEIFEKEAPALFKTLYPNYTLCSWRNSKHPFLFLKIFDTRTTLFEKNHRPMSVFIDIFAIDGAPADRRAYDKQFKKLKFFYHLAHSHHPWETPSKIRRCSRFFFKIIALLLGRKRIFTMMENTAKKYPFKDSPFISVNTVTIYGKREYAPKKIYASTVMLPFEGKLYPAPVGYDEYLTNLYKNYMQPPPPEKRVTPHTFDAYWN